jgi:dTDP-4-amino-4,6-dideoxygalactose transaminase
MDRIHLSPPDVGVEERALLLDAFDSGWIAPQGPHVEAFEREMAARVGVADAAALSSGTAALHLALCILGVGPGDEVLTSTLTFAASANAIAYCGATPVFVDADRATWQIDPELLAVALDERARRGRPPAAIVAVDLYGHCVDYDRILSPAAELGVPVIEDAAEALGATYRGRAAGALGAMGVLSFNGNKIITTSGGGMLLTDRAAWAARARFLATQARDAAAHYQHSTIGFNYRMSNLLAAVGRAQLRSLDAKVDARRRVFARYREHLADLDGVAFMPEARYGRANRWLTCLTIDPEAFGASRDDVCRTLADQGIEARPVWKPMHLQPVFADRPRVGGAVAADLFAHGLCLPSGSSLTDAQQERVIATVRSCRQPARVTTIAGRALR